MLVWLEAPGETFQRKASTVVRGAIMLPNTPTLPAKCMQELDVEGKSVPSLNEKQIMHAQVCPGIH